MTTIGSTAYYNSTSHYGGPEKTDNRSANPYTVSPQESESKSVTGGDNPSGLSTVTLKLQGKLVSLYMFDLSNAKPIDIAALPQDKYNEFMQAKEQLI